MSFKKIFFSYLSPNEMASFVKKDYNILKKQYKVKSYCYNGRFRGIFDIPRIFLGVLTSDINFSWFAYTQAYYAVLFSKILKKKSIVIIGGFDVAEEETNNKLFSQRRIHEIIFILNNADKILPVSNRLKEKAIYYTKRKDIEVIYHGFDYDYFKPSRRKCEMVITVGYLIADNLLRKGLLAFVQAAKYLPGIDFYLIGKPLDDSITYLKSISTENVKFTGWVSDEELLKYMQKAKVYVQVSDHEGFGCSLAEAMLCESTPVVTNRGAIPEVVGDTGIYAPFNDANATAEAIRLALGFNDRKAARERVKKLFPIENREKALLKIIESIE